MQVHKSALVPYSAHSMYSLVADIDSYPEFLPWCSAARIHAVDGNTVTASITLARGAVSKTFTTRNINTPDESVRVELVDGPFRHLHGDWQFQMLAPDACKILLDMDFEFSGKVVSLAFGPIFTQVVERLMDSFIKRATQVYGDGGS